MQTAFGQSPPPPHHLRGWRGGRQFHVSLLLHSDRLLFKTIQNLDDRIEKGETPPNRVCACCLDSTLFRVALDGANRNTTFFAGLPLTHGQCRQGARLYWARSLRPHSPAPPEVHSCRVCVAWRCLLLRRHPMHARGKTPKLTLGCMNNLHLWIRPFGRNKPQHKTRMPSRGIDPTGQAISTIHFGKWKIRQETSWNLDPWIQPPVRGVLTIGAQR